MEICNSWWSGRI